MPETKENEENKIELLYNLISEAQELIRFIETKTGIIITIVGAYVITFFTSIDKIIINCDNFSIWFWAFFC